MAREMEGDNTERRRRARDARQRGESPSANEVTYGASKQRAPSKKNASHQERLEARGRGKRGAGTSGKPRPGNRESDPKRTNRWE
jgi:hypothetical protein